MDSASMMMLWNLLLTVVVGIIGYIVKDKFDELTRLSILLNKTREEVARDNVTRYQYLKAQVSLLKVVLNIMLLQDLI